MVAQPRFSKFGNRKFPEMSGEIEASELYRKFPEMSGEIEGVGVGGLELGGWSRGVGVGGLESGELESGALGSGG